MPSTCVKSPPGGNSPASKPAKAPAGNHLAERLPPAPASTAAPSTSAASTPAPTAASTAAAATPPASPPASPPSLAKLALNFYAESLLRMAIILINTAMIARIDPSLMAATSAANQLFMLAGTLFSLTSAGCAVLIAQALGARRPLLAERAFAAALGINALFGAAALAAITAFAPQLLAALNTPAEVAANAQIYLKFMAFVVLTDALSWVFAACLRAHGFAGAITVCVAVMNALTIALNAAFLYGLAGAPRLGLLGVGLGNLIARCVCLGGYVFVYFCLARLRLRARFLLRPGRAVLAKILRVGGFSALSNLLSSCQYLLIFSLIARAGAAALAVQTMYFQLCFFIFAPAGALAGALGVVCGHLKGAGDHAALRALLARFSLLAPLLSLAVWALVFGAQSAIFAALNFTPAMAASAAALLFVSAPMELARALNLCLRAGFNACADVRFNLASAAAGNWLISLPLAFVLAPKLGLLGIWLAFCADEFVQLAMNFWRFRSGRFLKFRLV